MIDAIQPAFGGTSAGAADGSAAAESSDFETFLKMLTVQMQNQDPLNPVESTDYAVQLATFSGVEQQVRTNQLLESLTSGLLSTGAGEMVSWIGKEARAPVPVQFDGAPVPIFTETDPAAESAELIVSDSYGREVSRQNLPLGEDVHYWAGTNDAGSPLPNDQYRIEVVSYLGDEEIARSPAQTYDRITEIRTAASGPIAVFASGETMPVEQVTALREAAG